MRLAGGFDQPVRHERAGGDDGFDDAGIEEIGDDESLLGDGHGAGEGHDDESLAVAGHGFQHVGGVADLASGEGGAAHGADEVVHRVDAGKVEGFEGDEFVGDGIVQLALDAGALVGMIHLRTSSFDCEGQG